MMFSVIIVTMFSTTRCPDPESVPWRRLNRECFPAIDLLLSCGCFPTTKSTDTITRAGTDEAIESWMFFCGRSPDLVVDVFLQLKLRISLPEPSTDERSNRGRFPAIDLPTVLFPDD